MTFRKPNRTAPRFTTTSYNIINREFYKDLREANPKIKKLSDSDINKVIKGVNEEFWKTAIDNRDGVELESMLGYIFIGSCKYAKENINYKLSEQYETKIKHRNLDTDGNIAKIFYVNESLKYKFKFMRLWRFEPCRNFTTTVSSEFKKKWRSYISIPPKFRVCNLFNFSSKKGKKEAENRVEMYGFREQNYK